jgi:hypothetical protein
MIRHGDILLRPVEAPEAIGVEAPEAIGEYSEPGERLVLATGEATGHAHVLHGLAIAYAPMQRDRALVQLLEPGELRHEEHKTIQVPPGWYEVIRQRVYAPTAPAWVRD